MDEGLIHVRIINEVLLEGSFQGFRVLLEGHD